MNNEYSVKDKLTLFLLATGVFCFGVILPDSLSTHVKMVHYAAHFGMSFLLALCFYMICTVKMKISKTISYTVLVSATLLIGVIYKYWEIATQGMIGNYSFHAIIDYNRCNDFDVTESLRIIRRHVINRRVAWTETWLILPLNPANCT